MKEKLMEMMGEAKPEMKMSNKDIEAKRDVLMELLQMCDQELKGRSQKGLDEVRGMKVSVMAKDPLSLKEGLEKAEELTEEMPENILEEASEEEVAVNHAPKADILEEAEEEKPAPKMEDDEDEGLFAKRRKK